MSRDPQSGTNTVRDAIAARYAVAPDTLPPVAEDERLLPFLERSVCRSFDPDPVPEPLLTALLAAAQSAPSKSDLQQYSIVVVDDPDLRRRIQALPSIHDWVEPAPLLLVFVADSHRGRTICEGRGYTYAMATLDTLVNATGDAAIALATCVMAAERVGLGTCPLSVVRNHIDEIADLLGLPEGTFPFAGLAVGWPRDKAGLTPRLPQEVVVHRNRYREPSDEALKQYDAVRPVLPEKQMHRERYGVAEEYGWTENAARRLSVREREGFRAFLEEKGFGFD